METQRRVSAREDRVERSGRWAFTHPEGEGEMEPDKVLLAEVTAKNSPKLTPEASPDSPSRRQEGSVLRTFPQSTASQTPRKRCAQRKTAHTFRGSTMSER